MLIYDGQINPEDVLLTLFFLKIYPPIEAAFNLWYEQKHLEEQNGL